MRAATPYALTFANKCDEPAEFVRGWAGSSREKKEQKYAVAMRALILSGMACRFHDFDNGMPPACRLAINLHCVCVLLRVGCLVLLNGCEFG